MSVVLATCGCCEGTQQLTPATIVNRPGLPALAYRVGIHATFLETMLARLSNMGIPISELDAIFNYQSKKDELLFPLRGLTTRSLDDPAIALLDAWAIVAEVLTFYQERIANEGYLLTATERRSILELTTLIGYKLRPGVAASVFLAYTLENGQTTTIPQGSRVQSLPGPGQLPQPFETSFAIEARAAWNAIKPRMSVPQYISQILDADKVQKPLPLSRHSLYINTHDGAFYLQGTSTNLKQGDPLLFVFSDDGKQHVFGHTQAIDPHQADNYTRVVFPTDFVPYTFFRKLEDLLVGYQDVAAFGLTAHDALVQSVVVSLQSLATGLAQIEDGGLNQFADNEDAGDLQNPDLITIFYFLNALCFLYNEAVQPSSATLQERLMALFSDVGDVYPNVIDIANTVFGTQAGGLPTLLTQLDSVLKGMDTPPARLAAWVGGLLNEIKAIVSTVPAFRSSVQDVCSPVVTTSIASLLSSLAKLPSLQPANSVRLPRRARSAFARKSDLAPRILQTLNQAAAPNIYHALSHATATAALPLQYVQAFRVKAVPFGSTAPKPSTTTRSADGNTFTTGTSPNDWSLVGIPGFPFRFRVQDFNATNRSLPIEVALQEQESFSQTVSVAANNSTSVSLSNAPAVTVTVVTVDNSNTGNIQEITFKIGTITITATPALDGHNDITQWTVSMQGAVQTVAPGQTSRLVSSEDISVRYVREVLRIPRHLDIFYTSTTQGGSDLRILDLDAQYDKIVPESWVAIEYSGVAARETKVLRVQAVETVARADYGMSAKVTRLTLYDSWLRASDLQMGGTPQTLALLRGITIYAQSEKLSLAEEPLTEDVQGNYIELDDLYDGLQSGRWVVVSGERSDMANTSGVRTSELMLLESVTQEVRVVEHIPPPAPQGVANAKQGVDLPGDKTHTVLHFSTPLAYTYKRGTVAVGANVVKATHGETKNEVLGSGDGVKGMQQFTLKQSPLTYVAAATAAGAESTLHVYVNDIEWHEQDNLDAQGPKDPVFVTQTDDQDKTTVIFGNGTHGARLPTAAENVRAVYRNHIGKEGNVDAEQIKLLATRPLGVKGVLNPKAATGGADHEGRDQARRNAPLAVQALDRVVSVQDYADFARTFAGIAKANARLLSDGRRQVVHLTIAGQDNIPIDPTSDLYQNLFLALRKLGNPSEPLRLAVCEAKLLVLSMRVRVQADYQLEKVVPNIRTALLNAFGFEQRDLGQPIYQSEVLSVVQQVAGVAFVELEILDAVAQDTLIQALDTIHQQELQEAASGQKPDETQDLVDLLNLHIRQVVPVSLAQMVRNQPGVFTPAQLAFFTPDIADTLIINELTSPIQPVALPRKVKVRNIPPPSGSGVGVGTGTGVIQ